MGDLVLVAMVVLFEVLYSVGGVGVNVGRGGLNLLFLLRVQCTTLDGTLRTIMYLYQYANGLYISVQSCDIGCRYLQKQNTKQQQL